jgi:two-component system, sensor histidine kinase YesM
MILWARAIGYNKRQGAAIDGRRVSRPPSAAGLTRGAARANLVAMRLPRIGIRGKILLSYGLTIALVVAVEVLAQGAASRAGREFEQRLSRYYYIQDLRAALADFRGLGERYLRERQDEQGSELASSLATISDAASGLAADPSEPQEAFFEGRAAKRGIEAWAPSVRAALAALAAGLPGAYESYQKADRIALYVDGYLGRLLSISMASGTARYGESLASAAEKRRLAIVGLCAAGALALIFAALFAQGIAAPVRRLAEAADRMASGDLDVEPVRVGTRDEVADLAVDFNAMSSNIRALVEGLKEKAELERLLHEESVERISMGRALREAQFMNLQDQIRPHFLFNALNTISRSALLEGAPETELLARSLGKLMRYSLSDGGAFVTVGEELAILRDYLAFQSIRFGARLAWEVRSEPEAESLGVPRFTLQPLVENAVRHGIEPKVEGGRVVVSARRLRDRVRLVVADGGVGMDALTLAQIRAAAAGEAPQVAAVPGEGGPGIGMANLELRLAYRYGGRARLAIASRPGRGTVIRISLPATGAGERKDDAI